MRARHRFFGVIAAVAGLLASCGNPRAATGRVEVTLWKQQAGVDEEAATKAAIARFNASQSHWVIKAQSIPQGGYTESIVAASLAGQLPCLLAVDQPMVARFAWAGFIRPIDGLVPAGTLNQITPGGKGVYQGHVYSAGQFDAALALYTRQSALQRIGARIPTIQSPWSKAEFDQILHKLKATGQYRYPLDLETRDTKSDWWTYAFSPMLQSFGGDLIDRQTMTSADGVLNGPAAIQFGTWFQSLFSQGLVDRREPDENAFVDGRAAMVYTGNWWAPDYRRKYGGDLLILPPPDFGHGPVIGAGSWQWSVSPTCKQADGAAAFLRFMLEPQEIAAISNAAGMVPVTEAGAALSRDFRPGGQSRIFYELMQHFARSRPATPAFPAISNDFFAAMKNIMDGENPQDALDDAVDEIDQSIADNDDYRTAPKRAVGQ